MSENKERSAGKGTTRRNAPSSREGPAAYVWLNVQPQDLWFSVRKGQTIWQALQNTGVELEGECGGLGKCGKCKLKVLSKTGPPTAAERELLSREELRGGIRLACRTRVERDTVISIGEAAAGAEYFQILTTSHILNTGHLPLMCFEPLVHKRLIAVPPELQHEGLSDLERVRLSLAPKHQDLTAPLRCLRTLPGMLRKTRFRGVAVMHDSSLLAWQHRREEMRSYGLVFDLGTSTLVGKLINLVDGSEVAVASALNGQFRHGTDVISRLQYIKENADGLWHLNQHMVRDLSRLTANLLRTARLRPNDIFIAVAAGNTTMQHLLLGLDPSAIAEAPFAPVVTDGLVVRAIDAGLMLHPEALLYVMPAKAGYIGGDLISVVLASGAWEQGDEMILGLDLGTSGEIFLGNRRRLMT